MRSPTAMASESPIRAMNGVRGGLSSSISARSTSGSDDTTCAGIVSPLCSRTSILSAVCTTCAAVRIRPSFVMSTPEPSPCRAAGWVMPGAGSAASTVRISTTAGSTVENTSRRGGGSSAAAADPGSSRANSAAAGAVSIDRRFMEAGAYQDRAADATASEVSSDARAVLHELLTIVRSQERLLAQNLPVHQPQAGAEIDQRHPVREHQELPQQDQRESDVDGIAAEGEDSRRDQPVGMIDIDAHAKVPAERHETEHEEH